MIKSDKYVKIRTNRNRRGREIAVTVCVATIFNKNVILGASDRMITAGDIQYQPRTSKILFLTNSIAALVAGDIQTQKMVFAAVFDIVNEKINKAPSVWMKVKDVADIYVEQYVALKNMAIQKKVLAPFGLTHESYISKQANMSQSFISELSKKILQFDFPDIETLLVGCDESGAHIFSIDNDDIICNDSIGFAARGRGAYHAESHLMFNEYSPDFDGSRALLYTHRAKKFAETAPDVGKETDYIVIGPALGVHLIFPQDFISSLDDFYDKYKEDIKLSDKKNLEKISPFIREYAEKKLTEEMQQRIAQSRSGNQPINPTTSPISQT